MSACLSDDNLKRGSPSLTSCSIDDNGGNFIEEGSERGLHGFLNCWLNEFTVPCELNVHDEIWRSNGCHMTRIALGDAMV